MLARAAPSSVLPATDSGWVRARQRNIRAASMCELEAGRVCQSRCFKRACARSAAGDTHSSRCEWTSGTASPRRHPRRNWHDDVLLSYGPGRSRPAKPRWPEVEVRCRARSDRGDARHHGLARRTVLAARTTLPDRCYSPRRDGSASALRSRACPAALRSASTSAARLARQGVLVATPISRQSP